MAHPTDATGARTPGGPRRSRSPVPFALAGLAAAGVLGARTVGGIAHIEGHEAWSWFTGYVAVALLVGVVIGGVAWSRTRPTRSGSAETAAVGVIVLVTLVAVPASATSFAEAATCGHGGGAVVSVCFTSTRHRYGLPNLLVGTYTDAGARHRIEVGEDDRAGREVGRDRFRVPWIGSDFACGTKRDDDRLALTGWVVMGLGLGALAGIGGVGLVRRVRTRDDEFARHPESEVP